MKAGIRVLLLEDSIVDAELVLRELKRSGFETESLRVEDEEKYVEALEQDWDVILADFNLPSFDGLSALHACYGFSFLVAALYGRNITQIDGSVGNVRYDGATKLLDTLKFI